MAIQRVFYFQRADILTARDDDVFASVFDFHVTVGLHHGQIARVKPTACKSFLGGTWIFQIALHHNVSLEHDLTHGAAIGRAFGHVFRIHHSHAFLQDIANTLSAVQACLL